MLTMSRVANPLSHGKVDQRSEMAGLYLATHTALDVDAVEVVAVESEAPGINKCMRIRVGGELKIPSEVHV